jgi:hypothetical protein
MPRLGRLAGGVLIAAIAMLGCGNGVSSAPAQANTSAATAGGGKLAQAKFLIEHNATDEDTGFQIFLDGDPWNQLTVEGPGNGVLEVNARGALVDFGLTEGFFETNEPPNAEFPIEDVLALFPEGKYDFVATSVEGGSLRGTATLTHTIPAKPEILTPADGAVVDPGNLVISWNPVEASLTGGKITIEGYQVIVAKEVAEKPTESLFKSELSVFLPASRTSVTVPSEFLEPGADYQFEVLAIEKSGNQTIASQAFQTQ